MTRTTIGLFVGLILGYALVAQSFGEMLIVALIGVVGFVVGKALDGDLDLSSVTDAASRRRG